MSIHNLQTENAHKTVIKMHKISNHEMNTTCRVYGVQSGVMNSMGLIPMYRLVPIYEYM